MSLTFAEKVISAQAGEEKRAGEFVFAPVSKIMANELSGYVSIKQFAKYGFEKVFDPDRIILVPSHNVPNKDVVTAEHAQTLRRFAREQHIFHYYELGQMGIEHALLPEKRLILPGDLVVGGDSHTCTYGALGAFSVGMGSTDIAAAMATGKVWLRVPETIRVECTGELQPFVTAKDLVLWLISTLGVDGSLYQTLEMTGPAVSGLDMEARLTMCNMAVEAGAKTGVICVDQTTREFYSEYGIGEEQYAVFHSDPEAACSAHIHLDVQELTPVVAAPYSPDNVKPVKDLSAAEKVPVDQVVIGSCTNGRIQDLRQAAYILGRNKVAPGVRVIVIPATQNIYLQAVREGLIEQFIEAGAVVSTPTCGPCAGLHSGVLAAGEVAVSTTNRNFVGRMGHPGSKVYLASPYVAAATAVKGEIACPTEVVTCC
ncbi:3-isopropylmalate dehydratase large subunit [Desulfovermiculus halophilus]|uniref:3-isopropylmalate dehydratase large subunit n=1 Tax=Desulfovermiculus halophilus TaxID=339722 RepID=UPI0004876538|nr:3-isopropylmalate dehydratase large subunit [Desulfovermiculus halophilus]